MNKLASVAWCWVTHKIVELGVRGGPAFHPPRLEGERGQGEDVPGRGHHRSKGLGQKDFGVLKEEQGQCGWVIVSKGKSGGVGFRGRRRAGPGGLENLGGTPVMGAPSGWLSPSKVAHAP